MANEQVSTLPDTQTAYNNLFLGIHQRVFFQKCAAAGLVAQTREDAEWMLQKAGQLRALEEAATVKAAQDNSNRSPYQYADNVLNEMMARYGIDNNQAQYQEQELAIKQAALDCATDPTFYNSILSLKAAEAEQIRQQLAAMK